MNIKFIAKPSCGILVGSATICDFFVQEDDESLNASGARTFLPILLTNYCAVVCALLCVYCTQHTYRENMNVEKD